MALRFIDGFDASDYLRKGWAGYGGSFAVLAGGPYPGGMAMRAFAGSGLSRVLPNYAKTLIGATVLPAPGYQASSVAGIQVTNGTDIIRAYWSNSSTITLYRGATVLANVTMVWPGAVWQRHEMEVVYHASAGSVLYKINGVTVFNFTGQTSTAGTVATGLNLVSFAGGGDLGWYDDVVIMDGVDGTTLSPAQSQAFNTSLGDVKVATHAITGVGSSAQWTPSSAVANWTTVDEMPVVDTDFVTSATSGQRDLYAAADRSNAGTIIAVVVNTSANKDDAGARQIRHVVKSGSSFFVSPNIDLGASFLDYQTFVTKDPATSAAWTESAFNAAEFGYEVV